MRKSLFALESVDDMVDAEMETGIEEGEVAGVMAEGADDMADIAETSDAVSEGTEAAAQMGQVEDLMEDAAVNGGGLDPVAAEATRISVEAICARVGANPRSVYSLYATENFQSASSRKANTKIALEGVGQFLKDMWARIKASLKTLWEKVKAFFDKHVSSLGRIKKALESAKSKVAASSGKFKAQGSIEQAPSGLIGAFPGKAPISATVISNFITAHTEASTNISKLVGTDFLKIVFDSATGGIKAAPPADTAVEVGTESKPLVGGKYMSIKFGKGGAGDDDAYEFEVTRETVQDKESKLAANLSSKEELQNVLKSMLAVINSGIAFKAKYTKFSSDQNKVMNDIGSMIAKSESGAADDAAKAAVKSSRNTLNYFYKVNAKVPSIVTEMLGADVSLAKAVLGYTGLCLKNYK